MGEENKMEIDKVIYLKCQSPEVAELVLLTTAFITRKITAADWFFNVLKLFLPPNHFFSVTQYFFLFP